MNPKVTLSDVSVLEFIQRPYTNKKGEAVVFTEVLCKFQGKVLKFSCDKDCGLSKSDESGSPVSLNVELVVWGDSLVPTLRVASVSR